MHKLFLSAMVATCLLTSCKPNQEKELQSKDWSFKKEATLRMIDKNGDTLNEIQIEFLDTDYDIQLGMSYRDALTENQGLLFVFEEETPRYFYMKNTNEALDLIYINSDKKVDSYSLNAQPNDETLLESKGAIQYVLDVKEGMVEKWGLKEGDTVSWE